MNIDRSNTSEAHYSMDGIHLTPKGYIKYVEYLAEAFKGHEYLTDTNDVLRAMVASNIDPRYKSWQEPPFPKAEVSLTISVICKHFLHICMYYGYQTWEWHTPNWESDAIEFARKHGTFKSHAEYISTYLQDFKPVA